MKHSFSNIKMKLILGSLRLLFKAKCSSVVSVVEISSFSLVQATILPCLKSATKICHKQPEWQQTIAITSLVMRSDQQWMPSASPPQSPGSTGVPYVDYSSAFNTITCFLPPHVPGSKTFLQTSTNQRPLFLHTETLSALVRPRAVYWHFQPLHKCNRKPCWWQNCHWTNYSWRRDTRGVDSGHMTWTGDSSY